MDPASALPFVDPQVGNLLLGLLLTPDALALAYALAASWAFTRMVETGRAATPSVFVLVETQRREWMYRMADREPRMVDAQLIADLRRGAAFFASTVILMVGAGAALLSNLDPLQSLVDRLELARTPNVTWEVKILVVLLWLASASVNFIWSHRLFGYVIVLFGAMHRPAHPGVRRQADRAADLGTAASRHFRRGIQQLYFAAAGMFWLLGPGALALAATVALYLLRSREYSMSARRALEPVETDDAPD